MVLVKLMYRGLFRLLKWKCSESDTLSDPSIQRIAAIDVTGSLGGTITLLPALKTLKEGFPGAELHFVTVPGFDDLLRDCSYIDRFVDAPTNSRLLGVLSLARRLRAARYDLACSLIPSKKNALLALLSGAEYRVGYLGFPRSAYPHIEPHRVESIGFRLSQEETYSNENIVEVGCKVCAAIGLSPTDRLPQIPIDARSPASPYVIVHPFSRWRFRSWVPARYIELIRVISQDLGLQVVVIFGPNERENIDPFTALAEGNQRVRLASGLPLRELAVLMAGSALFVGNDTGTTHLAAACGARVLGLYGPAPPKMTATLAPGCTYLYRPVSCSPCPQTTCSRPFDPCLDLIGVEEVVRAVRGILETGADRSRSAQAARPGTRPANTQPLASTELAR